MTVEFVDSAILTFRGIGRPKIEKCMRTVEDYPTNLLREGTKSVDSGVI